MSFESFLLLISSLRNQFIYFAISISLPSILLYLAEMFVILRHRQFHNTFYVLILIRAIPNLLYTLDSYYCYRLTILFGNCLYPIYESFPNWMLRMSYFCTFYTMLADYLATILILLNRWTAIKMPLRHKTIWRKYLLHAIFIVFGLPLILYFQEFFVNAFNQIDSANGDNSPTSFFIAQDFNPIFDAFPINVIISCAFMAICIFINISTLREYRKSRQQNLATKNMAQRNQEKVESKLLAYALLTFVGHLVMAINQVLIYLVVSFNDLALIGTIYTQYPWTMDLGSVVLPSWLLFWASDSFRRQLIADFSPKWFQRLLKGKTAEITPVINLSPNGAHTIQIESQRSSENGGHIFVTRTQNI